MKTLLALGIAAVLALAAVGAVSVVKFGVAGAASLSSDAAAPHDHSGADEHAMHGGMAGDAHDAQLGMWRPAWPQAAGNVPSAQDAKSLEEVSSLQITSDKDFTPAAGVRAGTGTLEDPYVISGYYVTGDLYLQDTDACFVITGNYIDGQLTLNWNGLCVWVHHNFIRDLRVNENIQRVGDDTGGLIELNQINFVGQIRHFDGEFRNNVVGPYSPRDIFDGIVNVLQETPVPFLNQPRVLNIDGWNEALFHHNTIYGSTDLKLHGHHHSAGFLATHSHYHGDNESQERAMAHDHTDRWESVEFTDNKIVDPKGYGLHYTDENHAGDDRTASSESTKALEKPHQHHTDVTIARNELQGAGIWVDIVNADDELHKVRNPAWFTVADNTVALVERDAGLMGTPFFGPAYDPNTAISIYAAKEVQFKVTGNTMSFQKAGSTSPTQTLSQAAPWLFGNGGTPIGIGILGVRDANLTLAHNTGQGFEYGIAAYQMDEKADWYVQGNTFPGATHALYYDSSVENKPIEGPGPDVPVEQYQGEGHHHG